MAKVIVSAANFQNYIGHEFEPSHWMTLDQARIDAFAACAEDHQYIHVDAERAADTPFGSTIAHGFLVLSLLAPLCEESMVVLEGATFGMNYGFNKIRFLAPVRSGKRIRLHSSVVGIDTDSPSRLLITTSARVEIENETVPALIAEWLMIWFSDKSTQSV